MKNTLNTLFRYCGILSEVEPYGVFADLIPQQPLNRAEAFRAAQTIIPDIRAELPAIGPDWANSPSFFWKVGGSWRPRT